MVATGQPSGDMGETNDHFISYHARLHYDSENTGLFPTRGAKFLLHYAYFTDNFADYKGCAGFSELSGLWRISMAATSRLTFQPMVYGRMLFGGNLPAIRGNNVGGQWFAHYTEQQLPLAGLGHIQQAEPMLLACQLKAQAQLTTNNFVLLKVVAAQHADRLRSLFDHTPMTGCQLSYYYRTLFGPVGASLGYSSKARKPNFHVNLGFEF